LSNLYLYLFIARNASILAILEFVDISNAVGNFLLVPLPN
jgi:hypothetical protein